MPYICIVIQLQDISQRNKKSLTYKNNIHYVSNKAKTKKKDSH